MKRSLLFTLALVVGLECEAKSQPPSVVEPMTQSDLDVYFESIRIEDAKFTFARKAGGAEMICARGNNSKDASAPGSTFQVSLGTPFRLYNKESEIKFIPLPQKSGPGGFLVEELFEWDKIEGRQAVHVGMLSLSYNTRVPFGLPEVQLKAPIKNLDELSRWEAECAKYSDKTIENPQND